MSARSAAALVAVVAAAVAVPAARADLRIDDVHGTPSAPVAGSTFEVSGRILFSGAVGSIHCRVLVGGRRYRAVRLVWDGSAARCSFVVPANARGKVLAVGLAAAEGGNRARTTLRYRVA